MTILERIKAPTPKFYRILRNVSLGLVAAGGVIVAAPIALPTLIITIGGYLIVAGSVATAISQTVTSNDATTPLDKLRGDSSATDTEKINKTLTFKINIKMNETKKDTSPDSYREGSVADTTQTQVDVVVTPSNTTTNQNKISVTVTTDGKLTKADAGRASEQQQDVWVNVKVTKADLGKLPDIDVNIHEQWNTKITKVDSIKTA